MIVNRRTFVAKRGHLDDAVALLKEAIDTALEATDSPGTARFYLPEIAPFDILAVELEYEDWDHYHGALAEWAQVVTEKFWEQWFAVTENGGTNEVWRIVE